MKPYDYQLTKLWPMYNINMDIFYWPEDANSLGWTHPPFEAEKTICLDQSQLSF